MDSVLYIDIDVDLLRTNLSAEDGRVISFIELLKWLHDAGFASSGRGWIVRERDLGQLQPGEYSIVHSAHPAAMLN